MLILNNAHNLQFTTYKWKPKQDYSENGSIIYPRGTLIEFKGGVIDDKAVISKLFHESLERDVVSLVINTVAQYPFKKDDILFDDIGKAYKIITPLLKEDKRQTRYLKTSFISKEWFLGVETNE